MARIRRLDFPWSTCFTISATTAQFNPFQQYTRAPDMKKIRMGWEVSSESVANMISSPGYQLADVENAVVSTNTLGSDTQTSTGVKFPSALTDVSSNTEARQLFRSGIYVKNPVGVNVLHVIRVRCWLEWEDC